MGKKKKNANIESIWDTMIAEAQAPAQRKPQREFDATKATNNRGASYERKSPSVKKINYATEESAEMRELHTAQCIQKQVDEYIKNTIKPKYFDSNAAILLRGIGITKDECIDAICKNIDTLVNTAKFNIRFCSESFDVNTNLPKDDKEEPKTYAEKKKEHDMLNVPTHEVIKQKYENTVEAKTAETVYDADSIYGCHIDYDFSDSEELVEVMEYVLAKGNDVSPLTLRDLTIANIVRTMTPVAVSLTSSAFSKYFSHIAKCPDRYVFIVDAGDDEDRLLVYDLGEGESIEKIEESFVDEDLLYHIIDENIEFAGKITTDAVIVELYKRRYGELPDDVTNIYATRQKLNDLYDKINDMEEDEIDKTFKELVRIIENSSDTKYRLSTGRRDPQEITLYDYLEIEENYISTFCSDTSIDVSSDIEIIDADSDLIEDTLQSIGEEITKTGEELLANYTSLNRGSAIGLDKEISVSENLYAEPYADEVSDKDELDIEIKPVKKRPKRR